MSEVEAKRPQCLIEAHGGLPQRFTVALGADVARITGRKGSHIVRSVVQLDVDCSSEEARQHVGRHGT